MRLSSYLPIVLAMATAALASIAAGFVAADRVERGSAAAVRVALAEAEQDWTRIDVDGLQVILSGQAPDEASRFEALAAAGRVVDSARVIDMMSVAAGDDVTAPDFTVEFLRNAGGLSMIGLVPATTDRDRVREAVSALGRATDVADLLEAADYPAPDGWDAALDFALEALPQVPRSKVSVAPGAVTISAVAESEAEKRRLDSGLARAAPEGLRLVLDISAPRPVITPFTTRFVLDESGARFDACSAASEAGRDQILAAAARAGLTGRTDCRIGLGSPSVTWADAAEAGIDAVAELGGGKLTLSGLDVTLIAPATAALPTLDRVLTALEEALPVGFSLDASRAEAEVPADGAVDPETRPSDMIATRSPEGDVQLRGRIATELSQTVVESFAHAEFGVDETYTALRLDPTLPDSWDLRVLTGLEALAFLDHGTVIVGTRHTEVRGVTGNPDANAEIARLLGDRVVEGEDFSISVIYEESLDPLAGVPTPEECVALLNDLLAEKKITFEPGSSTIDTEGLAIIDVIADTLRTCQSVRMEIAGHTDSQGRESMNLRLSQARADAVLNAIMARRVLTSNLTAKGYGEERPIADNETEEGREANRRIEFTLVTAEETAEDTAAAPDSDTETTVE